MNESQNAYLSFSNSPGLLLVSVVVMLAALGICYWNSYCSQWRRAVVLLEFMRFFIVVAIVILFNQPEWTQEFRPKEKPKLVVLVDESQSMATRDVLPAGVTVKAEAQSRREASAPFTESETWAELSSNYDVQIEPFASGETSHGGTDIHASLESVSNPIREQPLLYWCRTGIGIAESHLLSQRSDIGVEASLSLRFR